MRDDLVGGGGGGGRKGEQRGLGGALLDIGHGERGREEERIRLVQLWVEGVWGVRVFGVEVKVTPKAEGREGGHSCPLSVTLK